MKGFILNMNTEFDQQLSELKKNTDNLIKNIQQSRKRYILGFITGIIIAHILRYFLFIF